jgi:hypothetical protein
MHKAGLAVILSLTWSALARAEPDAAPDAATKWVAFADKALGIALHHPAGAKVAVKGSTVTVTGPELATVTINVATTEERSVSKNGGQTDKHVDWSIEVPKRAAHCVADGADLDKAAAASSVCDSIVLTPGKRAPHVELSVDSSGLADGAAYEKAVKARQKALDACWKQALAKDADLPEGSLSFERTYEQGQPAATRSGAENFFDHDAKPLGACAFAILKAVPAKAAGDASAKITIEAVCRLY